MTGGWEWRRETNEKQLNKKKRKQRSENEAEKELLVITVLSVHEINTEIAKSRGKFFGASERDPIGVRCDLSV